MFTRRVRRPRSVKSRVRGSQLVEIHDAHPTVASYRTLWGMGTIVVSGGRLVGVELPSAVSPGDPGAVAAGEMSLADSVAVVRWLKELEDYFSGGRLAWTHEEVGLADLGVNPFMREVYSSLLSVPPATTVTYGELAEMAGHPRAARAVGNAMAANPIPVVVPCHRVIRADGSLGKYGSDPAWKERLLRHEQTHLPALGRRREG